MSTESLTLMMLILFLCGVIELVRRGKLTFKYALGWLAITLTAIFFVLFDKLLFSLARWFGFQLPSNFIFFSLLAFFVLLSLLLTTFICQQENHNNAMSQRIGMLELELEELKKKTDRSAAA